jgi:hypothetical protein
VTVSASAFFDEHAFGVSQGQVTHGGLRIGEQEDRLVMSEIRNEELTVGVRRHIFALKTCGARYLRLETSRSTVRQADACTSSIFGEQIGRAASWVSKMIPSSSRSSCS